MKRNNDRMLLESLVRKYGKNNVKNAIRRINENDNADKNNELNESTFTDAVNILKNEQLSFIHYLIYLNSKDNKIHVHIAGSDNSEDYIASNIDDALRIIYQNDPNPEIEIVNSLRALYI